MIQYEIGCPKCKVAMEEGFVADRIGRPTIMWPQRVLVSEWIAGPHELTLLSDAKGKEHALPITTYRCPSCGYLESYAH
jgi:Domain of unknown function (DUF6487)